MKKMSKPLLLTVFCGLGIFLVTSCGNAAKHAKETANDSVKEAVDAFSGQVHQFDSSWQDRLNTLNERIVQWDSSAKTYKGSLQDRMEEQLVKVKAQRDSLKSTLEDAKDQSRDKWDSFKKSVGDQYSSIVESLGKLSKLNQ